MSEQGGADGGPDTTPRLALPYERLATALRRVNSLAVAAPLDAEAVGDAAAAVERLADTLASAAGEGRRPRQMPDPGGDPREFFPTSPIIGLENPVAAPVLLQVVEGADGGPLEVRATACFDFPYEGPPGCVHGGVIAATFDELLGSATIVAGNPGMTGTLTIKYRKPTPLRADLTMEARYLGRDGRKVRAWGAIHHGDVLTAEAEGVFIQVGPAKLLEAATRNGGTADPEMVATLEAEVAKASAAGGTGTVTDTGTVT